MSGSDELLSFVAELAVAFPDFPVVASSERDLSSTDVPIIEITADESDSEICMVRSVSINRDKPSLELRVFYSNLKNELHLYPTYSLMVSEWFQIDQEHTARTDMPLRSVELDEEIEVFRLLF